MKLINWERKGNFKNIDGITSRLSECRDDDEYHVKAITICSLLSYNHPSYMIKVYITNNVRN